MISHARRDQGDVCTGGDLFQLDNIETWSLRTNNIPDSGCTTQRMTCKVPEYIADRTLPIIDRTLQSAFSGCYVTYSPCSVNFEHYIVDPPHGY